MYIPCPIATTDGRRFHKALVSCSPSGAAPLMMVSTLVRS